MIQCSLLHISGVQYVISYTSRYPGSTICVFTVLHTYCYLESIRYFHILIVIGRVFLVDIADFLLSGESLVINTCYLKSTW